MRDQAVGRGSERAADGNDRPREKAGHSEADDACSDRAKKRSERQARQPPVARLSDIPGHGLFAEMGIHHEVGGRRCDQGQRPGQCTPADRARTPEPTSSHRHGGSGPADVVQQAPELCEEAVERVRELTQHGAHSVLECRRLEQAVETALAIAPSRRRDRARRRPRARHDNRRRCVLGRTLRSLAALHPSAPISRCCCPTCSKAEIEPGRVFDRTGSIEDVPDGYRAMNDREVLKFQIKP